ncbi:TonB-dependent receptor domain-containing protein [Alkanindiges sp. WGS2144]|uniref:TonB-dependent receptor domain-containing protein n=1 Tax=Alkanindiges sp. WGS2144 TaxID=3366808 RepID=UPI0037513E7A
MQTVTKDRSQYQRQLSSSITFLLFCNLPLVVHAAETNQTTPAMTTQLPVIIIEATRTNSTQQQTPASVYRVDQAAIQDNQLQVNLSEALGSVPGIQVQNRQNYAQDLQLSMRGFGARSTFGVRGIRLYVDDIPATMPDGQGQTSNIDLTSADRIEVLTGPLSSLYGNSSGGTIQVYTEEGQNPPSVTAQIATASNETYRYALNAQGGSTDQATPAYVFSQTRFDTNGYRDHSKTSKNLTNAKLAWRFDNDSTLKLIINRVDLDAQDPLGLSRQLWQQNPKGVDPKAIEFNTRKTVEQTQGGLVYERNLNEQQSVHAMVYYGQRDTIQYQSIPVFVQTQSPGHAGGVIDLGRDYYGADLRWTGKDLFSNQNTTFIAGLAYDTMQEQRKGFENFRGLGEAQLLGVKGDLRRNETNNIWNIDPYLQAFWQFLPDWTVDAGLRYSTVHFESNDHYVTTGNGDGSGDARYNKLLPSLALSWQLMPQTSVYGSYGRGFETPTFNEISYRSDNQSGLNFDLKPSVNDTYEIGTKTQIKDGLLTTALFQTNTDDEIVTASNHNGRSSYQNAGRTRRQGVEATWNGRLADNLKAALSYTYLNASYRDTTASLIRGNKLPGVAKQSAYAGVEWAPEQGWQVGANVRYVDKIYVNDLNSDAAPAYSISSAFLGYVWQLPRFTIRGFGRVDNLFDKNYSGSVIVNEGNQRYFEPADGRNWSAGVSLSVRY